MGAPFAQSPSGSKNVHPNRAVAMRHPHKGFFRGQGPSGSGMRPPRFGPRSPFMRNPGPPLMGMPPIPPPLGAHGPPPRMLRPPMGGQRPPTIPPRVRMGPPAMRAAPPFMPGPPRPPRVPVMRPPIAHGSGPFRSQRRFVGKGASGRGAPFNVPNKPNNNNNKGSSGAPFNGTAQIPENEEECALFCDACDMELEEISYEDHVKIHVHCSFENCLFSACQDVLDDHVTSYHSSETNLQSLVPKTQTAEDIEEWIEQRKLRYPSKENVQKRYERQEARMKRGEKLKKNVNRFGKDKTRLSLVRPAVATIKDRFVKRLTHTRSAVYSRSRKLNASAPKSLITHDDEMNGDIMAFKGAKHLFESIEPSVSSEAEEGEISTDDDIDNNICECDDASSNQQEIRPTLRLNNSLGALMSAYVSGSEDGSSESEVDEVPIERKDSGDENYNTATNCTDKTMDRMAHQKFGKRKRFQRSRKQKTINRQPINRIKNGEQDGAIAGDDGHREVAVITENSGNDNANAANDAIASNATNTFTNRSSLANLKFKRRKVTLLEKLLADEIRHERNVLLQCVKYVVERNFFDKEIQ